MDAGFEWLRTLSVATSMVTVGLPIVPHLSLTSKVMEHVPAAVVRLRTTGKLQPVVIVAGDKAIGVLMPVKQ